MTADRSLRTPGSLPAVTRAWPGWPDCTAPVLDTEPPPNTKGLDPSSAPPASWVATASRPATRVCPVSGLSSLTADVVVEAEVRPPAIIRVGSCARPRVPPGSTTSREMGTGS